MKAGITPRFAHSTWPRLFACENCAVVPAKIRVKIFLNLFALSALEHAGEGCVLTDTKESLDEKDFFPLGNNLRSVLSVCL